ncbi:uncharacterized protein LOC105723014 [Aotus nancymaae]|uniref:uncharacterized protein LOC105723014 n=1 Tax=Aotus nancymaae TaxID=37293 RepID=UPI0030FF1043
MAVTACKVRTASVMMDTPPPTKFNLPRSSSNCCADCKSQAMALARTTPIAGLRIQHQPPICGSSNPGSSLSSILDLAAED